MEAEGSQHFPGHVMSDKDQLLPLVGDALDVRLLQARSRGAAELARFVARVLSVLSFSSKPWPNNPGEVVTCADVGCARRAAGRGGVDPVAVFGLMLRPEM